MQHKSRKGASTDRRGIAISCWPGDRGHGRSVVVGEMPARRREDAILQTTDRLRQEKTAVPSSFVGGARRTKVNWFRRDRRWCARRDADALIKEAAKAVGAGKGVGRPKWSGQRDGAAN